MQTFILYLCSFSWATINAKILKIGKKKNLLSMGITFMIVFTPIIIIYGMRYNVGVDCHNYFLYFRNVLNDVPGAISNIFNDRFEPGYVFLNVIAAQIIPKEYGCFLVTGFVMYFLLFWGLFYYRKELSISQGIFIFLTVYFGVSCNCVRQMLAVLVVLGSFKYILSKDLKKYLITIIIASLFHKSALFCIIFFLLTRYTENNKILIRLKLLAIILGFAISISAEPITSVIAHMGIYSGHATSAYVGSGIAAGMKFLAYVIPMIFFIEFFKGNLLSGSRKYQIYIILYYFQIPFQCFGVFNAAAERMSLYCSIIQVILIPLITKSIKNPCNRFIANVYCYCWYIFYFLVMENILSGNGIGTYQSILSK